MARRFDPANDPLLREIYLVRDQVPGFSEYPFSIPAIHALHELKLDPRVTFFVGDNGSGKSTLVEAIAIAAGFNAEGGSRNFNFHTRRSESELHKFIRLVRGVRRPRDGYFLRAESFFNVATEVERLGVLGSHGGTSLHEQSHGESFLALAVERFGDNGLYILDEPEAALSPQRQLSLLAIIHRLVAQGTQFIIATHSPILMAYPHAVIYQLGPKGIAKVAYEETEHFQITRDFLNGRDRFFRHLFTETPTDDETAKPAIRRPPRKPGGSKP
ncbi:MAG: AAA family ATPase [Myxococcota bacterium]|nr:AAA family ATPase [Myxococcota bacterium]